MGLLEDLERQAQQRRREEELSAEDLGRRRDYFRDSVRPAVGRIYDYVRELTNHVNYLKQDTPVTFNLPRVGDVVAQVAADYQLRVSKDDSQVTLNIETTAAIPLAGAPEIRLDTESQIRDMESILADAGITARKNTRRDSHGNPLSATFKVFGNLRRHAVISCRVLDDEINFDFTNFEIIGGLNRKHSAERVNDGFLDRLGRFLIGADSEFLKDIIDDGDREQIREQVNLLRRNRSSQREHDPDPREGLLAQLRDLWEKPK